MATNACLRRFGPLRGGCAFKSRVHPKHKPVLTVVTAHVHSTHVEFTSVTAHVHTQRWS